MKKLVATLALLILSQNSYAGANLQIQEATITQLKQELKLTKQELANVKEKLNRAVSDSNTWVGSSSGLKGDSGTNGANGANGRDGSTGPQGPGAYMPLGPGSFVAIPVEGGATIHIGSGGICLYAPGYSGAVWCK